MEQLVLKIAADHGLKKKGDKFVGPCPECGGSAKSDKFNIRLDGGFKCYSCSFKGDIITWLRNREGLSCPDAHEKAWKDCRNAHGCPASAECRFGVKGGNVINKIPSRKKTRSVLQHPEKKNVPAVLGNYPCDAWLMWANDVVIKARGRLLDNADQMGYLAERGIPAEAVERFQLGFLPHQQNVKRQQIGIETQQDEKPTLWVPDGLLIPIFRGGQLHRIRIRRLPAARDKFRSDLKYVWVKGSGDLPLVIMPKCSPRGAVIIEAELDAYAVANAHPDVAVVALGAVASGVDAKTASLLESVPVILVALDAEEGAGPKAVEAWQNKYRHAKFWPVLEGKDPGDYFKLGGDLHGWIEAGLPPRVERNTPPVSSQNQDVAFSPARSIQGGGGEENTPLLDVAEVRLSNGKIIYVTNDQETWQELMDEGKPVFTQHELDRLKVAFATMTPEQRIKAAMAAIEVKEIFGGYIERGENNATRSI